MGGWGGQERERRVRGGRAFQAQFLICGVAPLRSLISAFLFSDIFFFFSTPPANTSPLSPIQADILLHM